MRKVTPYITSLGPNEVFVFGSNEEGFHGAGAAGLAQRGDSRNNWREDPTFLEALKAPRNSPLRKGNWSVLGVGRGYQEGREGASYAIATVTRAGKRRSVSLKEILAQLIELGLFATRNPEKTFYCGINGGGYNGYTVEEMSTVYRQWEKISPPPENITFPKEMMP